MQAQSRLSAHLADAWADLTKPKLLDLSCSGSCVIFKFEGREDSDCLNNVEPQERLPLVTLLMPLV